MSAPPEAKILIVGIGDEGLQSISAATKRRIEEADLVLGSQRTLDLVPGGKAERVAIGTDLGEMIRRIERDRATKRIIVLASGDPLFYGIARFLVDRFGKEAFEVVPHVSSMQLAFARVMESWDEAYLTDLSQRTLASVVDRIRVSEKVGIFTTTEATPPAIAKALLAEGIDYFRVYVCENLGTRGEIVTQGTLAEIAKMDFGSLNVMVLVRQPNVPDRPDQKERRRFFGNPDDAFLQSRPKQGLITPAEVRTLALAKLDLRSDSIVWDIGAGSGSVSVECAQLSPQGRVFAIESDAEDGQLARDNAASFGVNNVQVVVGRAPDVFRELPDPNAIFIGGIGREAVGLFEQSFARLRAGGTLVANFASLENVSAATETLKRLGCEVELLLVNLARGTQQLQNIRFEALNPSFLLSVTKP